MGYCYSKSYLWRVRTYLVDFHSRPLLPFNTWNLFAELGILRVRGSRAGSNVQLRRHKAILSKSARFISSNNLQTSYGFRSGVNVTKVLHLYFTRVAIVSFAENNSCTFKLQVSNFYKIDPWIEYYSCCFVMYSR